MRIVVTGASGFVGREVLRRLPRGVEAVALARTPGEPAPQVDWVAADLCTADLEAVLPAQIDAVVHLAQARRYRSLDVAPDVVAVNVLATTRVLDLARRRGARLVHASTATLYAPARRPLDEDAPIRTDSVYAASKRAAELIIGAYDVPATVLRLFTVYGAGQQDRMIPDLLDRVAHGRPVDVQGEHGLVTSPIHVSDVAATIHAAVAAGPAGVLNAGGPQALSVVELARAIGAHLHREPVFAHRDGPEPGGFPCDRRRLDAALPGLPRPLTFAEGIGRA